MEKRNAGRVLMVKPEGKTTPGKPRCEWKDSIETGH
jgi:hypothetical protein